MAEPAIELLITAQLAQELLNYLVQRPYGEVYRFVDQLQKLQQCPVAETEKQDVV